MMPTRQQWLWMYETMVKSRAFEERIATAYFEGKSPVFNMANGPIPGEMHLSNGQEPCAVGVCAHLSAADFVTATHRPHHIAIAKGVDLDAMAAEIFGKKTGLSGGRGGHMHIFDARVNFACSGIIAQGIGPAVGAATAFKLRNEARVAVAFIGEGAANQGAFHESLNLAAVWQAPVIFVIEDNGWGISVAKAQSTAVAHNDSRAAAYGMPGHRVAGNDPAAIFAAAGEAIARARAGNGPSLIEIETSRLAGHFIGDAEGYRPAGEKDQLFARDPIVVLRQKLIAEQIMTEADDLAAVKRAESAVEQAIAKARAAPFPAAAEAFDHVFA
jgi:pyruvate dehydrogenase E1 component alpha subunit